MCPDLSVLLSCEGMNLAELEEIEKWFESILREASSEGLLQVAMATRKAVS